MIVLLCGRVVLFLLLLLFRPEKKYFASERFYEQINLFNKLRITRISLILNKNPIFINKILFDIYFFNEKNI